MLRLRNNVENQLTGKNGDSHRRVHEEQHVEEEEAEVAEDFGAVVTDVVVECADQEPDEDVSKQSQVHQSLHKQYHRQKRHDIYKQLLALRLYQTLEISSDKTDFTVVCPLVNCLGSNW